LKFKRFFSTVFCLT